MAKSITPEKLRGIKSLSKFKDEELAGFLNFVELTDCPKGTTLFHEGNPGDSMFLIVEGQLRVFSQKADGETVVLRTLEAGEAFGDIAFFHNMKRTASVEAMSDSVLIRLNKDSLENLSANQSGIASKFLFSLANSLTPMYSTFH